MSDQKQETQAIRIQTPRTQQHEHSTPLFMTSSFVFDSAEHARALFAREVKGNVYSRYSNPNTNEFVEKMCRLEKAEAGIATASGMSAIFSSLIATLPASTTHSKLSEEERAAVNIIPGMVRIAVGLEAIDDICKDIDQALG